MTPQILILFFTAWPIEWLVLVALGVASLIDTLRSGPNKSIAVSLAFLITSLTYGIFIETSPIDTVAQRVTTHWIHAGIFLVLFIALLLLFMRIISPYNATSVGPLLSSLTAIATVFLITAVWINSPTLESFRHIATPLPVLFSHVAFVWWILGALTVFAYVRS